MPPKPLHSVIFVLFASLIAVRPTSGVEHTRTHLEDVGATLFHHRWQPGHPAAPGGDGLGPVHNDVSCVACHHQGGAGGAGGIEKNATLLSLASNQPGMSVRLFQRRAAQLHPGLLQSSGTLRTTLVLHKFSTDPQYTQSRQQFVGIEMPRRVTEGERPLAERAVADRPVRQIRHASGIGFTLSQRNSPALFGAGLINAVPDQWLRRLAKQQASRGLVSGRVAEIDGRVGKFGWKAQTPSLPQFVRDACANELGLQVPGKDQAMHPLRPDYRPAGLDLNAMQLTALVRFVATLPPPAEIAPHSKHREDTARLGRQHFHQAGCSACHVESLGSSRRGIEGLFSDLLLHDMGPTLRDPVPAPPLLVTVKVAVPTSSGMFPSGPRSASSSGGGDSYGGGSAPAFGASAPFSGAAPSAGAVTGSGPPTRMIETQRIVPTNRRQEWRTPPLWGVAASAPYLHDGRASTLTEAILYHGGEAKFAVRRFLQLAPADRLALLEFLHTLQPPSLVSPLGREDDGQPTDGVSS